MPLVKQELFTLPEHINSPLFYRGWCWSIFNFLCSVLWIVGCPFGNFHLAIVLSVDLCLSFVNCHCVVCPSSTYGFWLLFWYLKICLIELHIYFILMKNSKVHKVWMLIIKKGISTNRYVHSVWINRNKIERITEYLYVIQCLLVQDAPFYILAFERWRIINKKTLLFTIQNVSDLIFYVELQG
jgi:hypothetical protein